jgi:hypothetical protein
MELYKLGIKFFAPRGQRVDLAEFIPVFHEWIQKQIINEHLLIDVHNYSHIHEGPGILLVAHQGNFSVDFENGRMGFIYYRKQPVENLTDLLKPAVQSCRFLSDDPRMRGRLNFSTDEALIFANDRLLAPNNDETFLQISGQLSSILEEVLGRPFTLSRVSDDPKERLTIHCSGGL